MGKTIEELENSNRSYKSANTRLSNEKSRLQRELDNARGLHTKPPITDTTPVDVININNSPEITEEEEEEGMENKQTTTNWSWLLWLLALLIFGAVMLAWHPWTLSTTAPTTPIVAVAPTQASVTTNAPVIEPTSAAVQNSMAQVEVPTGPVLASEPNPTCPGWNSDKGVSQWLPSGQTAIGDVVVNGIPQYDNGSGESTIVVNMSSKDVDIFAEWGSGCEWTTDVQSVVDKQKFAGCGDANNDGIVDMCNSVRIVLITDLGTEVKFVTPTVK